MKTLSITIVAIFAVSLFSAVAIKAQNIVATKSSANTFEPVGNISNRVDEQSLREMMKNDGLTEPVIDKLIKERKQLAESGRNVKWTSSKNTSNAPVGQAPCNDMGVENGWGAWLGDIGTANTGSQTWTGAPALPTTPYFSITTGTGIDPNTPSAGNPAIPYVCPGFGNSSIQLGEPCQPLYGAEQLTFPLAVTANDTNFTFAYAIVIEDAGHSALQQPFVDICIYDAAGSPIPGGCFRYTAGPNMPGFYPVSGLGCAYAGNDQYKPWTIVGIDLSAYVGQTLNVVITNVDCAQGGHWTYSYWDFSCLPITNPTSITENNSSELNISVFPNPFENHATLTYSLHEKSEVTLEVYNILGKKVNTIVNNETQNKGNFQYTLEREANAGFYLIKLIAGDKVYTQRLIQTQ